MSTHAGCDIVLTGLPRSGTNLACALLNRAEQTVALAEPMDMAELGRATSRADAVRQVERFLQQQRRSLLENGTAVSRHLAGQVKDNFFASVAEADGLRRSISERGAIAFDKPLDSDFKLVVKHPAAFSALLPDLAGKLPCFALIRNPLAVLASWNSNRIPVREGHAPAAERFDTGLRDNLARIECRMQRQIFLLGWFFAQFQNVLPAGHLIRYESLVQSGGAALSVISPAAASLAEPLGSRNASTLYDWRHLDEQVQRLLDSEGAYWSYYARDEIAHLFESATRR